MFQELVSRLVGGAVQGVQTDDPVLTRSMHFLAKLQQHLFGAWGTTQRSGIGCSIRYRPSPGTEGIACEHRAIGGCTCCGLPVCLDHALVSVNGDFICRVCVERAKQAHGPAAAPAPAPTESREDTRRRHLKRLGLDGDPSANQIRSAYKTKAAATHPDKFDRASATKKASAAERFKKLGESKDWLLTDLERRAAA